MIDVVEVLEHWYAGRPKSVVASSLGMDVQTVRKYVAAAEAAGMSPGGPPVSRAEWTELVEVWFPKIVDGRARSLTFADIDRHKALIESMLETNTLATVHQRLRDEHGLEAGITSFRRYVAWEFAEAAVREKVTVLRGEVEAGDEVQIDYGLLGSWVDPVTGRVRRVQAFVMVLACSRHMFVRPVVSMDQSSWVAAHVAGAEFFGGLPRRLVPDNLKTGVIKPDLYDPLINRAYAEFAAHYGVLVDPARSRKPKDKARVERPMPYVRDSFWRGREWTSVQAMQDAAVTWCLEVAGRRSHRSLEGASPLAVFNAVEADALVPLPAGRFELAAWSTPLVGVDCHIKVGKALYSIPWKHVGRRVDARLSDTTMEAFVDGKVVKTWARIDKGRQTDFADYPPEKVAFFQRTPVWCRRRAAELGPNVTAIADNLLGQGHTLHRLRAVQGILGLADRFGAERLDAACRLALTAGDPAYKTVKGILSIGADTEAEAAPAQLALVTLAPAHLRGPAGLFDDPDVEGEEDAS